VARELGGTYDVIMPDFLGHGLSDRVRDGVTFMSLAEQLVGLIAGLGLTKPILMGHSLGASVAAIAAALQPELPKAVILEDPPWGMRDSESRPASQEEQSEREEWLGFMRELPSLSRQEVMGRGGKMNPTWTEEEIGYWADSKLQFDPSFFPVLSSPPPPYEETVPQMKCPTLLLTSDRGIVTPATAENATALWQANTPFRWVLFIDAGHNIRREQFEVYCKAIYRFLGEIGRG
jgi:pimeloyl-ACP methyl ester carboxylesterase